jgi:hypothetical protein
MWNEERQPSRFLPRALQGSSGVHAEAISCGAVEAHPEYPLERTCVHLYEPFQLKFARHAEQILSVSCELEYDCGHHGLTIRGEIESELELAATILGNFYGSQVQVGPLRVRYHQGAVVEEPFMGVRVRCVHDRMEAVKSDLMARDGAIVSSELMRGVAFIRAVAPLRNLIGYGQALRLLAGEEARQLMWLSHYAPCAPRNETADRRGAKILKLRAMPAPRKLLES